MPPEVQAIGTFLGTVGTVIVGIVTVFVKIEKVLRERREKAVDSEPPKTPLLSEVEYVRNLRTQLDESERLHAAEARTLRRQVREMQDSIDELKADLIVATNERLKAERHGAEIVRQWRASNELRSNAPPPDPRTPGVQGAPTVPPKR